MLAVGQTERYNPAVAAVLPLVTSPRFIEVHRLGAFPDRSLDIDVVFDLMIHDLDIILALVRSDVQSIEAVGVPVLTSKYDIANARLRFAVRLHRQRDGQPDQQGAGSQDPVLSAGCLHLDRLRGAGSRGLAARAPRRLDDRRSKADRCRSSATSRFAARSPISFVPCDRRRRRWWTAPPDVARWSWRRGWRRRWGRTDPPSRYRRFGTQPSQI